MRGCDGRVRACARVCVCVGERDDEQEGDGQARARRPLEGMVFFPAFFTAQEGDGRKYTRPLRTLPLNLYLPLF